MREMEMTKRHSSARTVVLFAYISVLIVGLFACDNQKDGSSAHSGKLCLSLIADTTSLKKGVNSGLTKAVSDEFEKFLTVEDYQIRIVTDKDTVKSYDRFDKMPSEIELSEGAYTIVASKGNNLPASFENPYFEGSTNFTVKDGMSTRLDMTCTLGNARVTVESTDDFNKVYTDYSVDLKTALMDTVFRIKKDEVRPAYLQVTTEGTDTKVSIYVKKQGEADSTAYYVQTPLTLERRQNVRLILKLSDGNQGIGLDVMLDDELTYLPIDTKIPDYMYKPMGDAKLLPVNFGDNDEKEVQPAKYKENAAVHFEMKGGVSSLVIKLTKDNEDSEVFDIATAEGAAIAAAKNFQWSKTNDLKDAVTGAITDKWLEGYLFLDAAINSLQAPIIEDQTYLYQFEFSGKDATGKTHETNILTYNIIMLSAGAPAIETNGTLPTSIVEGDALSKNVEYTLEASSLIDKSATTLTINDQSYTISRDAASLKQSYGIEARFDSDAKAVIVFPTTFTNYLTVLAGSESKDYRFIFKLKDKAGKEKLQEKIITVYAPIFTFDTDNGAAFAKRVILHGTLTKGDPAKLSFTNNNIPVDVSKITLEGQNYQAVLTGLQPETTYTLQAIYNNKENRKSRSVDVVTEVANTSIPNAGFEEWSIAPDEKGNIDEGAKNTITIGGTSEFPYRYWELWQPWGAEVDGWNTLNVYTTKDGTLKEGTVIAGGGQTWTRYGANSGTIPVEGVDGGKAAMIRTVGWGSGSTAVGNVSGAKQITPGELYLGKYNSGAKYGINFTSRPTAFSFDYKYIVKNSDAFIAKIILWNDKGNIITETELKSTEVTPTNNWTKRKVIIDYNKEYALTKVAKMTIQFVSGKSTSKDDFVSYPALSNLSNGEYVGSQLCIDNVELIYE